MSSPEPFPPPRLSIVVVVYEMRREAPRTLYSLSPVHQRGVGAADYEVIVVENGSPHPLSAGEVSACGPNFRYVALETPSPSPAHALNVGVAAARADQVALMIDGARLATPGTVRQGLAALAAFSRPVVATLGFHLGADLQNRSMLAGYDTAEEDRLLAASDWTADGYRLFEIAALAGSSANGWLMPVSESNCLFLSKALYGELDGFDERFRSPGGGLLNLDFFRRACDLPGVSPVMLLGEATFHQIHGGAITNRPPDEAARIFRDFSAEYERLRERPYERPAISPILFGELDAAAVPWLERSCRTYLASRPSRPA